MSKSLTVVVLVLLVLTGAMGLRNVASANAATFSVSSHATLGNGPHPLPLPGGGKFGNGPHPLPLPGGGKFGNGPHPLPLPGGGGHIS